MNEKEQELLEALRGLSAEGPQGAPQQVEEFLVAELRRRRSGARRAKMLWSISAVAAIAAGVTVLIWMRPAPPKTAPMVAHVSVPASPRTVETVALPAHQTVQPIRRSHARPVR